MWKHLTILLRIGHWYIIEILQSIWEELGENELLNEVFHVQKFWSAHAKPVVFQHNTVWAVRFCCTTVGMHVAMAALTSWWHFANVSQHRAIAQRMKQYLKLQEKVIENFYAYGHVFTSSLGNCMHMCIIQLSLAVSMVQTIGWSENCLFLQILHFCTFGGLELVYLHICFYIFSVVEKISSNYKYRPTFVLVYEIQINHVWFWEEYWNSIEENCWNHIWSIHSCARSNRKFGEGL